MAIGDHGAPSAQRDITTSNEQAHAPARRSRATPVFLGIVALVLIAGGIFLYVGRPKEIASTAPRVASEGSRQPETASPPSRVPTPSASQPPSPPATPGVSPSQTAAAPTRQSSSPPSSPSPGQTAQAPPPAEAPSAQPQPMRQQPANLPDENEVMSVQVERANIRSAPRLGARVVATAHRGARLKVLRHTGKWVEVEADGRSGWINAKLLKPD